MDVRALEKRLIRPKIQSSNWEDLPKDARELIKEVDFKTRASVFLRDIKARALDKLGTPAALHLDDFCDREVQGLLNANLIQTYERKDFYDYVLEQVTGKLAGDKDRNGLRLFLCVNTRVYQRRKYAPEHAWIEYAHALMNSSAGAQARLIKWINLLQKQFDSELPEDLRAILERYQKRPN